MKTTQLCVNGLDKDNTFLCGWVGHRQLCVSGLGEHNSYVRVGWTNITELCVSGLDAQLSVSDGVGRTH